MQNPQSVFLWQGQIHLGDEPGIYGSAQYAGVCVEFPLTVNGFVPEDGKHPEKLDIGLRLTTENVAVYEGYPGHKLVIRLYTPAPIDVYPARWQEIIIDDTVRITKSGPTDVALKLDFGKKVFVSVAIEVDTETAPGLYDDFLFTKLEHNCTPPEAGYVQFGFQ